MLDNLFQEIADSANEILTECQKRENHDLVPLFQRVLHLAQLVKNRSFELWALAELEGYQNENVLQELKSLSKSEMLEYNNLQRLRSFPDDCFLETLKTQFLATGELVVTEPGRATLTMPLKELEMSFLTDREYYKQTFSLTAPLSLSLLERAFTQMKNRIYIFASEIYLRYRLAQNVAGIFDEKINSVNQRLAKLCPKVLRNLNQALEDRIIDKIHALASLKASLQEFAECLKHIPALPQAVRSLITRSEALYKRLKEPNKIGENEIEGLIIQTYFLISDALDLGE
jgi:hypothetical protein